MFNIDNSIWRFLWQALLLVIGSGTRLNSVSHDASCSLALQWLHFGPRTTLSSISYSWPLQRGRPHKPNADCDFTNVTGSDRGVRQKSKRGILKSGDRRQQRASTSGSLVGVRVAVCETGKDCVPTAGCWPWVAACHRNGSNQHRRQPSHRLPPLPARGAAANYAVPSNA